MREPFGSPDLPPHDPEIGAAYLAALDAYDAEQRVCDSFVPSAFAEDEFCADCSWNSEAHEAARSGRSTES